MKIIFSRKGFDSGVGKVASPIFPSGELCSLPIPESTYNSGAKRYKEIKIGNRSLGTLVNDLTQGKIKAEDQAHLDPDLNFNSVPRQTNWKPIFGQVGAAERHLQNNGVQAGDVFVFYGWFKQVEQCAGTYRYVKNAPNLHVIFGWLQIEQRISIDNLSEIPTWALDHPHCKSPKYSNLDSLYVSKDYMNIPNVVINKPGAGVFQRFDPALCLTAPSAGLRSTWRLPKWMHPGEERYPLSYHKDLKRWKLEEECVLLSSVGRGQEFVLDCQEYPEAVNWLCSILSLI